MLRQHGGVQGDSSEGFDGVDVEFFYLHCERIETLGMLDKKIGNGEEMDEQQMRRALITTTSTGTLRSSFAVMRGTLGEGLDVATAAHAESRL